MYNISIQTGSVKKTLLIILMVVVLFVMFVTTRYWPALQGEVLDEATGEPLAGVFVTARYSGNISAIADFQTVCYHAAGTTTDGQGRYRLPAKFDSPGILIDKHLEMSFFKPRYRQVFYMDGVAKLRKDESGREERIEYLRRVGGDSCTDSGGSQQSLYPYFEAIYYEAKSLAVTADENKFVELMRMWAARQAIAHDNERNMNGRELDERIDKYLEGHLK